MGDILDLISDAAVDTLKLLPFLYLTYLMMEFIEHKGGEKAERVIAGSGRFGPLVGSVLGIVPQCGFSAAAAGLYSGRIISLGTLLAVFLSTSDEMLPILISSGEYGKILPLVLSKLVAGISVGFAVDLIYSKLLKHRSDPAEEQIHSMCEDGHCHCNENLFLSALIHTLQITLFIFIASAAINSLIFAVGEERISGTINSLPFLGEAVAALVGLIPNCASSVIITNLYIKDIIGIGPALAGLLSASGLGLLILFKTNRSPKENLIITVLLYIVSVIIGFLAGIII